VECGAYIHELPRLYIGLQSDKFKNVHIADVEAHHPHSLETICPTRWLTTLSVVIWNKLPADARIYACLAGSRPKCFLGPTCLDKYALYNILPILQKGRTTVE